jgi:hypothetical protein
MKMHGDFSTTFIELIPKEDKLKSFENFRPIPLCNYIYKIISKFIVRTMKRVLSKQNSGEQCVFLEGRHIHEAVKITQ